MSAYVGRCLTAPKLVYVAGPYTGKGDSVISRRIATEINILRASELGLAVARLGACPIVPHANTARHEYTAIQPYKFWIDATLEQLRRCDAVIFTRDWQTSNGAIGEHAFATEEHIPIFYDTRDLALWLQERPNAFDRNN